MKFPLPSLLLSTTILAAALLASGCSSLPTVNYSKSRIPKNANYDNFSFLPAEKKNTNPAVVAIVGDLDVSQAAIKAILEERGYKNTGYLTSDFMVGLRAFGETGFAPNQDFERHGDGALNGVGTFIRPGGERRSAPIGADQLTYFSTWRLIVEVYDTESSTLVWSGWADVSGSAYFEKDSNRFKAMEKILNRFPN